MQIVAAIDLKSGQVVRAVAGRRDQYRPVESRLAADARAQSIGRALFEFGLRQAYVADLDAIEGRTSPAWDDLAVLADCGLSLWVDAGISSRTDADQLIDFAGDKPHINGLIVALESVADLKTAADCCAAIGPRRFIFSLDLKHGELLTDSAKLRSFSAVDLADEVIQMGGRRIIVLDLASVGMGGGCPTLDLCRSIVQGHAGIEVITGGGIRGGNDLRQLQRIGCSAALVGSGLHDGSIASEEVCGRNVFSP